jgi:hypothetical protein
MFDTVWMELYRKSEAKQEQHIADHAQDLNTHVHTLAAVAEAFLQAEAEGLDPFQAVYRAVPKTVVITTVQQARAIARPPTFDYLDLLEPKYLPYGRRCSGSIVTCRSSPFAGAIQRSSPLSISWRSLSASSA